VACGSRFLGISRIIYLAEPFLEGEEYDVSHGTQAHFRALSADYGSGTCFGNQQGRGGLCGSKSDETRTGRIVWCA